MTFSKKEIQINNSFRRVQMNAVSLALRSQMTERESKVPFQAVHRIGMGKQGKEDQTDHRAQFRLSRRQRSGIQQKKCTLREQDCRICQSNSGRTKKADKGDVQGQR